MSSTSQHLCDLRVATDPTSLPNELAALRSHPQLEVREALIRNPNAPLELLRGPLGSAHPRALLENPIFGWLILEQADLTLWPVKTLEALIQIGYLPPALRELALGFPSFELRRALCEQTQLTAAEIQSLLSITAYGYAAMLRIHGSIEWWQRERWEWRHAADYDADRDFQKLLPLLFKQPNFPTDKLRIFAADESFEVRVAVANHPQISFETFVDLYFDENPSVFSAARRRSEFMAALEEYTGDLVPADHRRLTLELRFALIAHCIPTRMSLYECAGLISPAVRFALARHPCSDAESLERAERLFSVDVCSAVLGHPNTDIVTLHRIRSRLKATHIADMLELANPVSLEAQRLKVLLEASADRWISTKDTMKLLYRLRKDW